MDKSAEHITQDIEAIVQTRVAIAEKLGAIEQHVGITMRHARRTMTELADKTTSTVRETMQVTKGAFDPRVHAARYPWPFVGGALILGYAAGTLYRRGWRINTGVVPYYPPGAKGAAVMSMSDLPPSERHKPGVYPFYPEQESDKGRGKQSQADPHTMWEELEGALHDELGVVRKGVVRFGRGLLREMVRQAVPALVQIIGGSLRDRDPCPNNHSARR